MHAKGIAIARLPVLSPQRWASRFASVAETALGRRPPNRVPAGVRATIAAANVLTR